MSQPLQYLTNEQGERVGVLLDWNTYAKLANPLGLDEECLVGLSVGELQALASCQLAVAEQAHLDELVSRNTESLLSTKEIVELDDLLTKADRLTILKTRARYTLKCLNTLKPAWIDSALNIKNSSLVSSSEFAPAKFERL
jgi:hypothetical protein